MKIEQYIGQLSLTEDCFTIAGLGGFICNNIGTQVHPVTHKFIPPGRKIVFNSNLSIKDLKLENLIMQTEGISSEKTHEVINQFVESVFARLNTSGSFDIKNFGRFYKDFYGNIEFEQHINSNSLDDSFGLPDLFFKPIERETMKNRPTISKKQGNTESQGNKKTTGKYAFALVPLALIIGIGAFLYSSQDQDTSIAKLLSIGNISGLTDTSTSSISALKEGEVMPTSHEEFSVEVTSEVSEIERGENMVSEETENTEAPVVSEQPVVEEVQPSFDTEVETTPAETASITSGNYTIIVGAFSQKTNADKLLNKLSANQIQVSIIEPNSKSSLYKIAVGNFSDLESAKQDLENMRTQYGSGAWVMSVK